MANFCFKSLEQPTWQSIALWFIAERMDRFVTFSGSDLMTSTAG
jgi:hypothetical protein